MPPRMRTQSVGRPAAESLGWRTGERVGRGGRGRRPREGNDERIDDLNGQRKWTRHLLPAMLAQVSNRGNVGNQNGKLVTHRERSGERWECDILTRWIEKIESVHDMSGCSIDQKVKYIGGLFVGHEMQKLESELWNHAMVGAGHAAYTDRFHELARNQSGNVVNENVRNVLVNGNGVGCLYKEFLACNHKECNGKGGVVVLTCWIKKMEPVQDMSDCSVDQKVKYTAGLFMGKALTWWNSQICTLSQEVVNHAMVGAGHAAYSDRFHELARLVPHLVTPESRMIERYVYGRAPQIHGMVAATEPNTMIPLPDSKVLRVLGERSEEKARLLMSAKANEKNQEKIVVVRDFPEVFPDDLSGLPPIREIEF
ncbi:hypothetical protein Tco_0566531 [Tanacetum coccineum]